MSLKRIFYISTSKEMRQISPSLRASIAIFIGLWLFTLTPEVSGQDGYIMRWLFWGPMFGTDNSKSNLKTDYLISAGGESYLASLSDGPTEGMVVDHIPWQMKELPRTFKDNLARTFDLRVNRDFAVCYAVVYILSPEERDTQLLMGSDDGNAVWLNGVQVHFNPVKRPLTLDQDMIDVRLRKGLNLLMIKVENSGGYHWSMSVRFKDDDGLQYKFRPENLSVESEIASKEEFDLDVNIVKADNLHDFNFDLSFDPTVLRVVGIREGTFLSRNGRDETVWRPPIVNNRLGIVKSISASRAEPDGVSGNGVLITITFKGISDGVSPLRLHDVTLRDSKGVRIEMPIVDGKVKICGSLGTIRGSVKGNFNKPIMHAKALAFLNGKVVNSSYSDETGVFILNLPAGTYKLMVSKPGYIRVSKDVTVRQGLVSDVSFTLRPDGIPPVLEHVPPEGIVGKANEALNLTAKVTDDNFVNVTVIVRSSPYGDRRWYRMRSSGNGVYEILIPPRLVTSQGIKYWFDARDIRGNRSIIPPGDPSEPTYRPFSIKGEQITPSDGAITGVVKDKDGKPLPGVLLVGRMEKDGMAESFTNEAGEYKLEVKAGVWELSRVYLKGYHVTDPSPRKVDLYKIEPYYKGITVKAGDVVTGKDFVMSPDTTPPTIEHLPVEVVPKGQGLEIEAKVWDAESGLGGAINLKWRYRGERNFHHLIIEDLDKDGVFKITLPMQGEEIKYFLWTDDRAGNYASLPPPPDLLTAVQIAGITDMAWNTWSRNTKAGGDLIRPGDVIKAVDPDGVICGAFIVKTEGEYNLRVYGDDPSTPEDEGAKEGDSIKFLINGVPALPLGPDKPIWKAGKTSNIDLMGSRYFRFIPPRRKP